MASCETLQRPFIIDTTPSTLWSSSDSGPAQQSGGLGNILEKDTFLGQEAPHIDKGKKHSWEKIQT